VIRGLASADVLDSGTAGVQQADRILYLVHLAVFCYISGLLAAASAQRRDRRSYLRNRLGLFVYLYVLWTALQGTIEVLTSSAKNSPRTWSDVFTIWVPLGQLWFLPFLCLVTVVIVLIRPWRRTPMTICLTIVAGVGSLAAWGTSGGTVGTEGLGLIVVFLLGACVTMPVQRRLLESPPVLLGMFTALSLAVFVALVLRTAGAGPTEPPGDPRLWSVLSGIAATLAGVSFVLGISQPLSRVSVLSRVFGLLGRRSLEIFLAHIVFASGIRVVLLRLGVTSPPVHVAAGLAVGVVAPLALAVLAPRLRLGWLFALPAASGPSRPRRSVHRGSHRVPARVRTGRRLAGGLHPVPDHPQDRRPDGPQGVDRRRELLDLRRADPGDQQRSVGGPGDDRRVGDREQRR
jgi:fucose 4-O-acetylase-like acetyltransferase